MGGFFFRGALLVGRGVSTNGRESRSLLMPETEGEARTREKWILLLRWWRRKRGSSLVGRQTAHAFSRAVESQKDAPSTFAAVGRTEEGEAEE